MEILILDAIRNQRHWVPFDPAQQAGRFRDELVSRFGLPERGFKRESLTYSLERLSDGARLNPEQALGEAGITSRDTLELLSPDAKEVYETLERLFAQVETELKRRGKESLKDIWERVLDRADEQRPQVAEQVRTWLEEERLPTEFKDWAGRLFQSQPPSLGSKLCNYLTCHCSPAVLAVVGSLAIVTGGAAGLIAESQRHFLGDEPPSVSVDVQPALTAVVQSENRLSAQIATALHQTATPVATPTAEATATASPTATTPEALTDPSRTLLVGDDSTTDVAFRQALRAIFPWYAFDIGMYEVEAGLGTEPIPLEEYDPRSALAVLREASPLLLFVPDDEQLRLIADLLVARLMEFGIEVDIEGVGAAFIVDAWLEVHLELPELLALIPRELSRE